MKFDCGLTRREKLDKAYDEREAYFRKMKIPHRWFAWHPVRVGYRDCRWLEYVSRSASHQEYSYLSGEQVIRWTYKALS